MKKNLKIIQKRILADTLTPVIIYLKLRDLYPYTLLLESSDYESSVNSKSIICASPISRFVVKNNTLNVESPGGDKIFHQFQNKRELLDLLTESFSSFHVDSKENEIGCNGFFGYMTFDSVKFFEPVSFNKPCDENSIIPEMIYAAYRFVIVANHFKNEILLIENLIGNQESELEALIAIIRNRNFPMYTFQSNGEEKSYFRDADFLEIVSKGKQHCQLGDVFQVVLSRKYSRPFLGDDFNVYRALRSINPSPYLFYFDMGEFRIFGSSPEAQLTIKNNKAAIFPIAGTYERNGDPEFDKKEAEKLLLDEKENAEHVMLVDLARNDLSRSSSNVSVESFKEIQYFSHVIHMVSRVTASLGTDEFNFDIVADTFPAGTLSGAPKIRAIELISELEDSPRGYYGGAIGYISFNGEYNHAIMIRSFLSKNNQLTYQAGAGIVAKSNPDKELDEVNHKLNALRQAIENATKINYL
jgi:anthranilate synthase component 1